MMNDTVNNNYASLAQRAHFAKAMADGAYIDGRQDQYLYWVEKSRKLFDEMADYESRYGVGA